MLAHIGDTDTTTADQPLLVLAGTYTLDPLLDALEFWIDFLDLDLRPLVAPYAQMFQQRSEEHTSELQSLMRISYAVFCLKKKKNSHSYHNNRMHKHQRL